MSWTVIIPVKRLDVAKSRLRGALVGVDHHELVLAMTLDTTAAALASTVIGRVVIVTSDPVTSEAALRMGADVIDDVPDAGLNSALAYAATLVRPRGATASLPGVAALTADVPALRTAELTDALREAQRLGGSAAVALRGYVADTAGSGTVLLAAPPGVRLEPCFGAGSAAAHAASGAVELNGTWPSLRRDVDTAADLADAMRLGIGPRTRAVTESASADPRPTVPSVATAPSVTTVPSVATAPSVTGTAGVGGG